MKKLLLALAVLVGSVLPSIAQDDTENGINLAVEKASKDFILRNDPVSENMVFLRDLLNDEMFTESDWEAINDSTIETVLKRSVGNYDTSFVEFLIDNGMPLSEYGRYIKFAREMWQEKKKEKSRELGAYPDYFFMETYRTAEAMLSLLLTRAIMKTSQDFSEDNYTESMTILKNILKNIDESDWKLINKNSVVNTSVPFVKFLISLGMPENEIDGYHIAAKEEMNRCESTANLQGYERCRSISDFFEEIKQEEMLRKATEIHNNIGELLRKNAEEKMQQWEQQYNQ